jgi:hypothetical protein
MAQRRPSGQDLPIPPARDLDEDVGID